VKYQDSLDIDSDFFDFLFARAREDCSFFPGEEIIHKSFENPSQFKGSEEEIMKQVRRVRDEIKG
jgi:hypothetical protein